MIIKRTIYIDPISLRLAVVLYDLNIDGTRYIIVRGRSQSLQLGSTQQPAYISK